MKKTAYITKKNITGDDIKLLRHKLTMTQREFSEFLNVSKPTIERWEKGDSPVSGVITLLYEILMRNPEYVAKLELPKKEYRLRLHYMYKNILCTLIDADEGNRLVKIRNYVDIPLYKAFGVNENPTFEQYEEFLESRCFPRSRDKSKLQLSALGLPFYDPLLIIEKTEGRMAEDDFWIKVER